MKYLAIILLAFVAISSAEHRVKRQGGNDKCRTCEMILNIAEHHFHNNISDQTALQAEPQRECHRIGQAEGDQAGQDCLNIVNTNIDKIYSDLHAGKRPRQTCEDIGACHLFTRPTMAAANVRAKRQSGNDICRTCEMILNVAEHHFHRNITDQGALQAELQRECHHIGQAEGHQAGQDCLSIVNNNIDTIYNDLHAGKRPRQTCEDIGACNAFTRPTVVTL